MERMYSDWLYENGVCSSEWEEEYLKEQFMQECIEEGSIPVIDVKKQNESRI